MKDNLCSLTELTFLSSWEAWDQTMKTFACEPWSHSVYKHHVISKVRCCHPPWVSVTGDSDLTYLCSVPERLLLIHAEQILLQSIFWGKRKKFIFQGRTIMHPVFNFNDRSNISIKQMLLWGFHSPGDLTYTNWNMPTTFSIKWWVLEWASFTCIGAILGSTGPLF